MESVRETSLSPCEASCASAGLFETLLPRIERTASAAYRHRPRLGPRRQFVADVVARAYALYRRLIDRGLASLAYSSALARYAIRQVYSGRQLGSRQNVRDVLSEAAQRKQGFHVASGSSLAPQTWEAVTTDERANPADLAALRLDLAAWLARLGAFQRRVAERLIAGDTTSEAAFFFRVSAGRISQLRRQLRNDWTAFQAGCLAV